MGIPDFQKLDKWEDTVKFAVSVRVLRLKMNSRLKKKPKYLHLKWPLYKYMYYLSGNISWMIGNIYTNFKIIWHDLFEPFGRLAWHCSIPVLLYWCFFLSKPILNTMARNFFSSLTVNGFQDFILECLLAVAALALIILLA